MHICDELQRFLFSFVLVLQRIKSEVYYCRGKGPRSYIRPWALSNDINRPEDKQIMMKDSQTKFRKKRANEWLSEEYILLKLYKYGSKYITQQLK